MDPKLVDETHCRLGRSTILLLAFAALGGSLRFATAADTKAATITIGSQSESNGWPFAISDSGTALYSGEYQQIYASDAFSEPILITQVAFASQSTAATAADYNLTLSFGVTTRSPSMPGSGYAGPVSSAFTGSLSAFFTGDPSDFDLTVPLTLPFTYHPGDGNLLLDVQIISATATGPAIFFRAEDPSSLMGRVYNLGGTGPPTAGPNEGLVTQFAFIQLPEPSIIDPLCPCAGPAPGKTWKNHGDYVSCAAKAAEALFADDLITAEQKRAIVEAAVQSNCGKK